MLLIGLAAWLAGMTPTVLIFGPIVVAFATIVHRAFAGARGQLDTGFAPRPLAPDNRARLIQLVLRTGLAVLVVVAGVLSVPRARMSFVEELTIIALFIVAPAVVFALLQFLPGKRVSRSLNLPVLLAVGYLGFQLVQVHFLSGLGTDSVAVAAPFEGTWTVGSSGRSNLINHHFTPFLAQRDAVDFLVADDDERTYDGDPNELSSYFCWDQPILSPAAGTVVVVEADQADQPIGGSDPTFPAGNYVVIALADDNYVVLAHLKAGSVAVERGDVVSPGDVLGRCGNSGNTTEPHLHMQIQNGPLLGISGGVDVRTFPMALTGIEHVRGGDTQADQQGQLRQDDVVRVGSTGN